MQWVEDFYRQQRDLMPDHSTDVVQHERLAIVHELSQPPPSSILELGAGAGEFAVAAGNAGHDVTAIELVADLAGDAGIAVTEAGLASRVRLIAGDFYSVSLHRTFETVCYWDGFGIGTDADQVRLLERISHWLTPGGRALIDVYTPWYWEAAAGRTMEFPKATRRYEFDTRERRMLDTWWPKGKRDEAKTQSLRCYAPLELEELLQQVELELLDVRAGGAIDSTTGRWNSQAPLGNAMAFVGCLGRTAHR